MEKLFILHNIKLKKSSHRDKIYIAVKQNVSFALKIVY